MRPIPERCERSGCGKPAIYDGPDGLVLVLVYDLTTDRFYGAECWLRADPLGERVFRLGIERFKGFPEGYVLHQNSKVEARQLTADQRGFRWALTDTPQPKTGGLVRMDNSGVVDTGKGW